VSNFREESHEYAALREVRVQEFTATYGADPDSVQGLFRDGNVLAPLLQHMYLETMDELRETDLAKHGARIQGQAQLLWTLLNLPREIEKMNTPEPTE